MLSKYFWNKNCGQDTAACLNVHVIQACHWFHSSKAFADTRDSRTYAQVTKIRSTNVPKNQGKYLPSLCTHTFRIVTVNSRNVNAKSFTPSKVGIKNQSCTPTPSQPSVTRHSVSKHDGQVLSRWGLVLTGFMS